jgi:hypothetical protein
LEFGPISNWIAGLALLITVLDRLWQARKNKVLRRKIAQEAWADYHLAQEVEKEKELRSADASKRARLGVAWHIKDRLTIGNAGPGAATNVRCRIEAPSGEPLPIEQDIRISVLTQLNHEVPFVFTRLPHTDSSQRFSSSQPTLTMQERLDWLNRASLPTLSMRSKVVDEIMPDALYVSLQWDDDAGGGYKNRQPLGKPDFPPAGPDLPDFPDLPNFPNFH